MKSRNEILSLDFSNWKCRASASSKVRVTDITETQFKKMIDLGGRKKPLTEKQNSELDELLKKYMSEPKLSVGAKTFCENEVDKVVFDFIDEVNTKQMDKGTHQEIESIEVHNAVYFTKYTKAVFPNENEYLKTESCDVLDDKRSLVLDIKTPWSKKTFPKTKAKAYAMSKKAGYPDQLQSYMDIYKVRNAQVSFNLVSTPEEDCQWEDETIHDVDHLPIELRNTKIDYKYSQFVRDQIYTGVKLCRIHMQNYYLEILKDHGLEPIKNLVKKAK